MRTDFMRRCLVALMTCLAILPSWTSGRVWAGSEDVPIIFFSTPPAQKAAKAFSPPPPYFGDNLSSSVIKSKIIAAGQKYDIPPHVLFGIAYQESVWKQFRTNDRRTTYHLEPDGRVGVGMMQMTVDPSDPTYERLCTDFDYNLDRAAILLNQKWRATPIIGDNARDKIENWYYAIWAYNGFTCPNPNDYAPKVLAHIGNGRNLWTPVTITPPNVNNSNCSLSRIANTPTPTHIDSNYDGVIDATISTPLTGLLLFGDNFDSGNSAANWQTNKSIANTSESEVNYAYDYSQLGIPSAPRSVGGSTIGARFLVNKGTDSTTTAGNLQGISASPIGKTFSGNFKIRFDLWINYVGSLGTGGNSTPPGSGSTQMTTAGWGARGDATQWSASNHSVMFAADGDGGITTDYRAYSASSIALAATSGAYGAGTASNSNDSINAYYSTFGDKSAPQQAALFPSQTGTTPSGALGFAWRDVLIEKADNILTWSIDNKRIASVDVTGKALGGSNIFLGMFDINATSSTGNDQLNAAIFDNVSVSTATGTSGLIISEFRFRGPGGLADEYVELYNTTGALLDISGWSLQTKTGTAASPAIKTSSVPQNTVVPARGHFLFAGSTYSLSAVASADAPLVGDAISDSGVALFNAAGALQDAVGFAASPATLREGSGLASAPVSGAQHAFMRGFEGQFPKNSGDSTQDFVFVTTDGANASGTNGAVTAQLGSPNPENLSSPVNINAQIGVRVLDANFGPNVAPNRVRTGSGNGGSLLFRRIIKNNGTQPLNRIRLQITDVTGLAVPVVAGRADVRVTSQPNEDVTIAGQADPVTVYGMRMESPSIAPTGSGPTTGSGGGLGASVNYDIVLTTPLAPGEERAYGFNVQVARTGSFFVNINVLAK